MKKTTKPPKLQVKANKKNISRRNKIATKGREMGKKITSKKKGP